MSPHGVIGATVIGATLLALPACAPVPPRVDVPAQPEPQPTPAALLAMRRAAACAGPEDEPPRPQSMAADREPIDGFVGRVLFEGHTRLDESLLRRQIGTSAGSALDHRQLAADVARLWQLGAFDDVAVSARGSADDLTVVFQLREHPVLGRLFFAGCDECDAEVPRGPYGFDTTRALIDVLGVKLRRDGYRRARVTVRRRRPEPTMVDVCVQVARGPRAVVRELAFDGNEAFDDAALASKCAIHIGDPLDDRQLVACASAVAQHYADRGHVHAQLAEPRVTMSDDGTALVVALDVDEGPSFRVGSVRVEGAGDTLPVLQLQAGQLFSRLHVDADRQALSRAHGARVEVDTHIDEQKKLIDVTLRVIAPP